MAVPACFAEGHIFLADNETANSLLPVTTAKLIAEFRPSYLSEDCFDYQLVLRVAGEDDSVHRAGVLVSVPLRLVSPLKLIRFHHHLGSFRAEHRNHLVHEDVVLLKSTLDIIR